MTTNGAVHYQQWYNDAATVRKMMLETGGALCPACCTAFDQNKHRRLIDACGHEICYTCVNQDHCPICIYNATQIYNGTRPGDPRYGRPRMKTNGHFTTFMQARDVSVHSPERPAVLPLPKQFVRQKTLPLSSPQLPRFQRGQRRTKWPNPLCSETQTAFSDDESQSSLMRNQDLYMRLGLLLGKHTPLSKAKSTNRAFGSQTSYASISSLASSETNTANTSPLSTLTDSSEIEASSNVSSLRTPCREQSSDSVVSLMSTSTGSCSSPVNSMFQRHIPARTSDSFIQIGRRGTSRSNASDDSVFHMTDLGRKSHLYKVLSRTLKPLYFEVPQQEIDSMFVGRHWLFREIDQEFNLNAKSKKCVVIMGGPGSGKTAIAHQLVQNSSFKSKREDTNIYHDIQSLDGSDYAMSNSSSSDSGMYQSIGPISAGAIRSLSNRLVAYHFCQADNNITCLVPEFVHSLAAYLCRAPHLVAYRDLVMRDSKLQERLSMPSCISDASAAFINGILEPLHMLRSQNKIPNTNCFILVDGLNEAEFHRPDYGDTIASFLIRHIQFFPHWLKLIVTLRTSYSEALKSLPSSHIISLDKVSSNEGLQKDILSYVLQRINSSPAIRANITVNNSKVEGSSNTRFATHLTNLSKGCMLYVKLTLDLIERGSLVVKSSSYRVLPVSLNEVYMLNFNLKFTTSKSYERVMPLFQVCLASLYPLTLQELQQAVNARYLEHMVSWEDFMQRLHMLMSGPFLVTRQDGTVMFAHTSMREWLLRREENESNKFLCDARAGHSSIALQMTRSNKKLSAEDVLELGHHVLKAHIYRSSSKEDLAGFRPRDLQAYWINLGSSAIESALSSLRNIYSPNVKVSRLLLLAGANPELILRSIGNTPLLALASYHGFRDMVFLLVEFGANVNAVSDAGFSALTFACQKGHLDIVKFLLSVGAKINQTDNEGNCPLVHASSNGHLDIVMHLVKCDWPTKSEPMFYQSAQRALVGAAAKGQPEVCEYLLDMPEVRINATDEITGQTALTAASAAGHLNVCETLIRRGVSVTTTNRQKESPLSCAAAEGYWEIVEKLLLRGASLEQADVHGHTALTKAAIGGHPLIELLLSKGANPEISDKEGMTPLCWAVFKNHFQTVQCLLSHNANPNRSDHNNRTPLDFVAYSGNADIARVLLDAGATLEHVDQNGMRPLERAIASRNIAVIVCFLHKGAKLGSQTWALTEGKPDILLILLTKLLEDATLLYKRMRLKDAAHRYQYALKKFPVEKNASYDRQFQLLKYQLYTGLSRCRRKMNEPLQALQAGEQAVSIKPKGYEGFYARGRAHLELGNHECALNDITEALRLAPQNLETRKVLLRLKDEMSAHKSNPCDTHKTKRISDLSKSAIASSTETIDQLCSLTLDIVADLEQMNDRMQDSGCESNH